MDEGTFWIVLLAVGPAVLLNTAVAIIWLAERINGK